MMDGTLSVRGGESRVRMGERKWRPQAKVRDETKWIRVTVSNKRHDTFTSLIIPPSVFPPPLLLPFST